MTAIQIIQYTKAWAAPRIQRSSLGEPTMNALSKVLATALALAPLAGEARITKIEITTRESPAYGGATFGAAGQYERLIGTLTGEVDPADRRNAIIQDIQLAPKTATGKVTYTTTFLLVKPIDMSRSSRVMYQQVPNRGGRLDIGGGRRRRARPWQEVPAGPDRDD